MQRQVVKITGASSFLRFSEQVLFSGRMIWGGESVQSAKGFLAA
jgi:hypothetical protein